MLAYHDVRPVASGYHVTPTQLAAHLRVVRAAGLRIVPLGELVDRHAAGAPTDDLAAVTFDDALVGVTQLALPVLEHLDVPATVFAVSRRLGVEPDWTTGEQRTLDEAELVELARRPGITIGSHAATHRSLPTLSDGELEDELRGSQAMISARLAVPVDLLAYPYGHHDHRVRAAATASGYRAGFTFLNGRVAPDDDVLRLPRLTVGAHHTTLRLAHHVARSPTSWPDTQLDAVR